MSDVQLLCLGMQLAWALLLWDVGRKWASGE